MFNVLMPVYNSDSDEEIRIWDFNDINGAYNVGRVTASLNILRVLSSEQLHNHSTNYIDFDYEYLGKTNVSTSNGKSKEMYGYDLYLGKNESGEIYYYMSAEAGYENIHYQDGISEAFKSYSTECGANGCAKSGIKYILNEYKGGLKTIVIWTGESSIADDEYIYAPEFD